MDLSFVKGGGGAHAEMFIFTGQLLGAEGNKSNTQQAQELAAGGGEAVLVRWQAQVY